jgi:hypothetical protein
MDGANISGQDLRGMRFTHLDLQKVTTDTNTKIDKDHLINNTALAISELDLEDLQSFSAIILLDETISATFSIAENFIQNATVYKFDESERFRTAAQHFAGPKFFIRDVSRAFLESKLLSSEYLADFNILMIVVYSRGYRTLNKFMEIANRNQNFQTIVVPTPTLSGYGAMPVVSGPLIDLLSIIAENWIFFKENLSHIRFSCFFRAHGTGRNKFTDAWCQVLSNTYRSQLMTKEGYKLIDRRSREDMGLPDNLFPQLNDWLVDIPPKGSRRLRAGVLLDINSESFDQTRMYASVIEKLLQRNGWLIQTIHGDLNFQSTYMRISGENTSYDVAIQEKAPLRNSLKVPPLHASQIDFDHLTGFMVCEAITDNQIIYELINKQNLWVTARDISIFRAEEKSIWSLISHQMQRFIRSMNRSSSALYVAAILRHALRSENQNIDPEALHYREFILDLIGDIRFLEKHSVSFKMISRIEEGIFSRLLITIRSKGEIFLSENRVEVEMEIAALGPSLVRFEISSDK